MNLPPIFSIPATFVLVGPPLGATMILLGMLLIAPPEKSDIGAWYAALPIIYATAYLLGGPSALLSGLYLGWRTGQQQPISLIIYYTAAVLPALGMAFLVRAPHLAWNSRDALLSNVIFMVVALVVASAFLLATRTIFNSLVFSPHVNSTHPPQP